MFLASARCPFAKLVKICTFWMSEMSSEAILPGSWFVEGMGTCEDVRAEAILLAKSLQNDPCQQQLQKPHPKHLC